MSKFDLNSTFVVLQPDQSTALIEVTPTVFEELDRRFDGFRGRVLISSFSFDSDWVTWEMHPVGDEVVCLLTGDVTMVLDRQGVEETVRLREPGTYIVIPKGTWHTARTSVPSKMLFVTPGQGTENKPIHTMQ
jgi:mannose-6-phosphate isomerase-like protein (cupin superfamily)